MNEKNSCAGALELAAYFDGRLSADERQTIELHLADHPECRNAVTLLRSVLEAGDDLAADDAPEHLMQKAIALHPANQGGLDLIISLMKDTLAVIGAALDVRLLTPCTPVTLRTGRAAGAAMVIMKKTFDAITAEVNMENLQGNACNISVCVTDGMTPTDMHNIRVDLISEGRELASSLLENGKVLFEDVRRGRYDIVIQKKGATFGTMAIKIV
jgi:hypothetical protein